jgi:ribosomal protein L23
VNIYPVSTEKAIGLITKRNTLVFVVDENATKRDIKDTIEKEYAVKVASVRVHRPFRGGKRAFVKLAKESNAMDLAAKLKIL